MSLFLGSEQADGHLCCCEGDRHQNWRWTGGLHGGDWHPGIMRSSQYRQTPWRFLFREQTLGECGFALLFIGAHLMYIIDCKMEKHQKVFLTPSPSFRCRRCFKTRLKGLEKWLSSGLLYLHLKLVCSKQIYISFCCEVQTQEILRYDNKRLWCSDIKLNQKSSWREIPLMRSCVFSRWAQSRIPEVT